MDPCVQYAVMFLGSVIGAGFASGREVVSFFSVYGSLSWGLILLTAATTAALCCLCLRRAGTTDACRWCAMYPGRWSRCVAEGSVLLLQAFMGGSMLSAGGHIAALCLPLHGAYLMGVAATIALALALGHTDLRPMTYLSGLLTVCFLLAVLAVLVFDRGERIAALPQSMDLPRAAEGAFRAVAYAALNLAVSIGLVCRCAGSSCRVSCRCSVLFGFGLAGLLFVSNFLYLKHPELHGSTFPLVALLARFGKAGYLISLLMMYLAILTTLSAGLYALRTGLEAHFSRNASLLLTVLLPLAVSCAGFENMVDSWYAPVGLLCLGSVFVPLMASGRKIS